MPTTSSPLRYPGGKSTLSVFMADLLKKNGLLGAEYVEPFAGGAGVAIELLLSNKVKSVILNDCDRSVWAFWKCLLERTDELCSRIETAQFSIGEWKRQRAVQSLPDSSSLLDLGYSTLYLNRTNYSGIIRGGIIGGKQQKGNYKMDCRFNKVKIIEKIRKISKHKKQIKVYKQDCLKFLRQQKLFSPKAFIYLDPPYYDVGGKIYWSNFDHSKHIRLAEIVFGLQQPWVMTYDCGLEINQIYAKRERMPFNLNYSANVKGKGVEILMWESKIRLPYRLRYQ